MYDMYVVVGIIPHINFLVKHLFVDLWTYEWILIKVYTKGLDVVNIKTVLILVKKGDILVQSILTIIILLITKLVDDS